MYLPVHLKQKKNEVVASFTAQNTGAVIWTGKSPVNGEGIALVVNFRGNKKLGQDFWQLSVLPLDGNVSEGSAGRWAICGNCPFHKNKSCYAKDQGLSRLMSKFMDGGYPEIDLSFFLDLVENHNPRIRFGRFGDCSLVPFEMISTIATNCKSFTGYTNQWRANYYDHRFNDLFMVSTVGEADRVKAINVLSEDIRTFNVIGTEDSYTDNPERAISCPSVQGFTCTDCGLCDGNTERQGAYNIEIKAHGVQWKKDRTNAYIIKMN